MKFTFAIGDFVHFVGAGRMIREIYRVDVSLADKVVPSIGVVVERMFSERSGGTNFEYAVRWVDGHGRVSPELCWHHECELIAAGD